MPWRSSKNHPGNRDAASSGSRLIAEPLVVIAAALVAFCERRLHVCAWILLLDFLELCRHLAQHLVVFLAAGAGMERGFESHAIEFLVGIEILALSQVVFTLRAAQPDPPLLTGRIHRFRSFHVQKLTQARGGSLIRGLRDHHAAAF